MPTYEYQCSTCGNRFEKYQSFSDEPVKICPNCGNEVRKVFSAAGVIFKGSGWYINDSRKSSRGSKSEDKTELVTNENKSESKSEAVSNESKSESKSETASSESKSEPKETKSATTSSESKTEPKSGSGSGKTEAA